MKHHSWSKKLSGWLLATLLFCCGCSDDVQSEYSHHRAFFRFPMVSTTPQLLTALNNPGMFCTITFPPQVYRFSDADGRSTDVQRTALEAYGKPIFIAGFLVGTPALGSGMPVAYDLVCPFCYENAYIQHSIRFKDDHLMECGRCGRQYDLNNNGIISKGGNGSPLYKYHISYNPAQNLVMIQN